jgi:hypothetical protein
MWAFLSARLRMWLIVAVVAPLVGWLLGRVGDLIESRRGPNSVSKVLKTGREWLRGRTRGPLAARPAADTTGTGNPGAPLR